MAKESMKAREVKRAKLVAKYAEKKKQLKAEGNYEALQLLPKNASRVRLHNRCKITGSAPIEAANSALVTLPSSGCTVPMVSQAMTRPSLFWMDSRRSLLVKLRKSDAQQSSKRLGIVFLLVESL